MSNPTELPDLDKLEALVREYSNTPTHSAKRSKRTVMAEIHELFARRAQPEGEAPQTGIVAWYRDEQVDANEDTQNGPPRYFTHRALVKGPGRPRGEDWRALVEPAATLSPLCGAQHAESGKEVAVPGWEQRINAVAPALRVNTKEQAMEAEIAGWRALAAQQAAAPGALGADEMTRLRRLMRAIGWDHERDESDKIVRGTLFAVLGRAADKLESAPGTPEAPKKPAHGHRDDYYLLANGRRLGLESISRVRNMPNWVLAMQLFATGSTSAHQICRDAGIDPDSTTIQRAAQLDGGQEGSAT